jgi:hypothetical protein
MSTGAGKDNARRAAFINTALLIGANQRVPRSAVDLANISPLTFGASLY